MYRSVFVCVRNPVEAYGRPLPASLPRAYSTTRTSWRQQCAPTEAGMLGVPGLVSCRHAQPERCMHMHGCACGPVCVPSVKVATCARSQRATAAPAVACDGGLEWRASGLSREPSNTRGGARAGMLQGVRVRARVCTCRREAHHAKTCARNDAPSTRPHEDVKISPCRAQSRLSPGRLHKPMPTSTAEVLRDRARPSTRPCTRPHQSPSASAKTTRNALHLRQSGVRGE